MHFLKLIYYKYFQSFYLTFAETISERLSFSFSFSRSRDDATEWLEAASEIASRLSLVPIKRKTSFYCIK